MGGIFSGSWTRNDCKSTVEERNSVSVKYLKEQGCLREGISGTLSWSRYGEPCGSIGYRVKASGIQFNYRSRTSDHGEWENVELLFSSITPPVIMAIKEHGCFALIVISGLLLFIVRVNIFFAESAVS